MYPLGPEAAAQLLAELLGSDPSVGKLAPRIAERTGGNPFFIEEVVQALVEAGRLSGTKGTYRVVAPVGEITIPATVQAVLAARIDRLGEREKAVLQAAAVIGKEFSEPVLRAVLFSPGVRDGPLSPKQPFETPPREGGSSGRAESSLVLNEMNSDTARAEALEARPEPSRGTRSSRLPTDSLKGEEDLAAALDALTSAEFLYPQALYPIGVDRALLEDSLETTAEQWGTGAFLEVFSASRADDPDVRSLWARIERHAVSPGGFRALARIILDIDVRSVLPSVRVPALVLHAQGDVFPVEIDCYFAEHIPGARWVPLAGVDHYPWFGPMDGLLEEIEEFLTGTRSVPDVDRVLATVLFTDIVGPTQRAAALGDRRWRELLDAHDVAVRRELARARGREVKTTGDGFFAAFDGPARAIRCAVAIREQARTLGIDVRAGLHTGECERRGDDLAGIAVHIGARVAALAQAGEVLVTSTVRDLVAGSGIVFTDRGVQALKGVPNAWRLLAVRVGREADP